MKKLTQKQQAFADCYDGNGTQAAFDAGYAGDDNVLAQQARVNLRIPQILQAIRSRQFERLRGPILSREQRQEMWTDLSLNACSEKDRLQASKLLAMSECDFITKAEIVYPDQIKYTKEEQETLKKLAIERAQKK